MLIAGRVEVIVIATPLRCIRPVAEDRRHVFGVLLLDQQARAALEVERVGAASVIGFDDGRDPRRRERSLRELCVASGCEAAADLDHMAGRVHLTQ